MKNIMNIGIDKKLHFLVGACIYFTTGSLLAVAIIGLLKEIWDEYDYGGFDYVDLLATALGGVVGWGITLIKLPL